MQAHGGVSRLQGAGVKAGIVDTFESRVGGFGFKDERSQVQQQLRLLRNKRWVFQEWFGGIFRIKYLQSLEDTQVGYISQKYTLDKYTLEEYTLENF